MGRSPKMIELIADHDHHKRLAGTAVEVFFSPSTRASLVYIHKQAPSCTVLTPLVNIAHICIITLLKNLNYASDRSNESKLHRADIDELHLLLLTHGSWLDIDLRLMIQGTKNVYFLVGN